MSSAGTAGAVVLLRANIHCFEPSKFKMSPSVTTNSKTVPLEFENNKYKSQIPSLDFRKQEGNIFRRFTFGWN